MRNLNRNYGRNFYKLSGCGYACTVFGRIKLPILMLFLFCHSIGVRAQTMVTGLVTDQDGKPIPQVSISVKGSNVSTLSDNEGRFTVSEVQTNTFLIFSHIGYIRKEVSLGGQRELMVRLDEDAASLDEVVVVGYGTQKKSDLTGAIHRVDASQYETQSPTNLLEMLSGTVAGFNSNQGRTASGGGSMEIRGQASIKASNNPLIVLDGVIYRGSIGDINPSDIATIDILKDASSAAVFGAQSAAGVMIITTKRGRTGAPAINFSADVGVSSLTNIMRPLNPDEYMQARSDILSQRNPSQPVGYYRNPHNLPPGMSLDDWLNYDATPSDNPTDMWLNRLSVSNTEKSNYFAGRTVDWYDEVFQNGLRQNYDLSISGGTPGVNYYLSGGYTNNEGVQLGDEFNIFRSRLNLDIKATNFLKISADINFSLRDQGYTGANFTAAYRASPYGQIYAEDGSMEWYTHEDLTVTNPLIYYTYRDNLNEEQNLFATISAELSLPFGIMYKPAFSNSFRGGRVYRFDPVETPIGFNAGGSGSRESSTVKHWMLDNIFSWNKLIADKHQVDVTFLYNIEQRQSWSDSQSNSQFLPSDVLSFHALQAGNNPALSNNDNYSTGTALMGRVNYSYLSKYLLTLTFRRDGYSAFGQENPYANFPSAAMAWRISEESFFNNGFIDDLKLRLSWGANGNRAVGIYDALARLSTTRYLYGTNMATGVFSSTMANSALRWETTEALNAGLDFELFGNRLSGAIDLYHMKTTDLLMDRSLPVIIGYSSVAANLGELQNRGLELTFNSRNIDNKAGFSWNSSLVFSFNRNRINRLYGDMVDILDNNGNVIGQREGDDIANEWFIGQSIDRIWDYERLGIWQVHEADEAARYGNTPGDIKLRDQNGDGVLAPLDDKVFQGYSRPQYRLGLRNDIRFLKDFELSFFIRADLGFYRSNPLYRETYWVDRRNILYAPYWTADNPSDEYPKVGSEMRTVDFNVWKNSSFVRLQDLSLSYSVPAERISRYKMQGLRVYLNMRNLYTMTDWNHWDPELGTNPMPRNFTLGVNINL